MIQRTNYFKMIVKDQNTFNNIISTLDNQDKKNKIKEKKLKNDLYKLVKTNLEKTRKQNELIILVKSNLEKARQKLIINSDTN